MLLCENRNAYLQQNTSGAFEVHVSETLIKIELLLFWILRSYKHIFLTVKINNFRGDLSNTSAKKASLVHVHSLPVSNGAVKRDEVRCKILSKASRRTVHSSGLSIRYKVILNYQCFCFQNKIKCFFEYFDSENIFYR